MKIKCLLIILCYMFFLVSCATSSTDSAYQKLVYKEISKSDKEYIFPGVESCSSLYTNGELSILEVYCSKDSDGLYIYGKNYQTKFDWFDKEFNLWRVSEGCNSRSSCYYEVKVDESGSVQEFKYNFFINLSEGYYKIGVIGKTLNVTEKKIIDHPS